VVQEARRSGGGGVSRTHDGSKWKVDLGVLCVQSLATRNIVTDLALKDIRERIAASLKKGVKKANKPDCFGPNISDARYKTELKVQLRSGKAMCFDKLGNIKATTPPSILPTDFKLLPLLLATKTSKYRDAALKEMERAVREGKLLNWAHQKQHADYLGKLIFKVGKHHKQPHLRTHCMHLSHVAPTLTHHQHNCVGETA
jgi:hypothetical protein